MREGKHQIKNIKSEKKHINVKNIFICIILIGVIVGGGFYLKDIFEVMQNNDKKEIQAKTDNEEKKDEKVVEKAEKLINSKAPIIWYYDKNDVKEQIKDKTLFKSYTKIAISRGNIIVFTKDGKDFRKEYAPEEKLTDGEYFIKVEAEDGNSCEKSFIIDTIPPKVSGIINGKLYTKMPTIKFADISDIKEATLTTGKKVIDLKKQSENQEDGTSSYEVKEKGEYKLVVRDIHGLELKRIFEVEI